jgi:predicted metal-dependent hydrolase
MIETIQFGTRQIDFHLEYSERKTLGISVTPELKVLVKAPLGTSLEKIKTKLRKRASWIIRQESFFLSFHPKTPARKFISGETLLYLGRQYRLKINLNKKESIKLKGGFIEVVALNHTKVKKIINEWYLRNAKIKIRGIAQPLIDNFKKHNVEPSSIVFRDMPTRWGSCTPRGKIIINPELIKAPKGCIEYVIIHELCHLVHHDHTPKFIDLQIKEMPDWEKWKMKLEKLLA